MCAEKKNRFSYMKEISFFLLLSMLFSLVLKERHLAYFLNLISYSNLLLYSVHADYGPSFGTTVKVSVDIVSHCAFCTLGCAQVRIHYRFSPFASRTKER